MTKRHPKPALIPPAKPAPKPLTAAELEAQAAKAVQDAKQIRASAAQSEITATVQAIMAKYGATVTVRAVAQLANGAALQIDTADFALVVSVGDLPAAKVVPGVNEQPAS